MKNSWTVLLASLAAAAALSLSPGATLAQQSQDAQKPAKNHLSAQAFSAALDDTVAAGKSKQELAQYVFDTHGCESCHTMGQKGKLGFTGRGKKSAAGSEGCISLLNAMSKIAPVPVDQRSQEQRQKALLFQEFGCTTCHSSGLGKMGLTEVGAKLSRLHLGCVDIEKLVASPGP